MPDPNYFPLILLTSSSKKRTMAGYFVNPNLADWREWYE